MKKLMIIAVLVGLLVFAVATSAFAESSGTYYLGYADNDMDTGSHGIIGMEINSSDSLLHRVGVDFFNSTAKGNNGADGKLDGYKLKMGFDIISNDNFELYGIFSYLNLRGDSKTGNAEYEPLMVGIEAKLNLNERMYIDGSVDCAVGEKEYKRTGVGDVDADYMAAKVKFNYLFTEKFGVNVGYSWDKLDVSGKKTNTKGLTSAMVFRF